MGLYSRDIDIGPVRAETINAQVTNLSEVVAALETVTAKIEEATEELKKIALGTGLILGQEIEEAE